MSESAAADSFASPGGVRCALCHEVFGPARAVPCSGCSTLLHEECATSLGRCPTIGCARGGPPSGRPPHAAAKALRDTLIYGPRLVFVAALLGSFAAGLTLMALNEWRLQRRAAALGTFVGGVAATALLVLLSTFVPEDSLAGSRFMAVAVALVCWQAASIRQGAEYGQHVSKGGRRGRWWGALGISLLAIVFVLLPVAGGVLVARFGLGALTSE